MAEQSSVLHTPGEGKKCTLKDPSGAMQLQWMLRALEFFFTMLKYMWTESKKSPVSSAYADTLQNYHGFMASTGIKAALLGMPDKKGLCANKQIAPGVPNEQ